ncbi:helix-turn-helix transcriptional regulator [Methylobacterium nodulans]|nr:hypothetical protein [Methylobacterium nodulans]
MPRDRQPDQAFSLVLASDEGDCAAREWMRANDLISIQDFAAMAGVSVRQVRRWHAAGQGPERVKRSRQKTYRRAHAEAWIEARNK